jgi:hypothetical protein
MTNLGLTTASMLVTATSFYHDKTDCITRDTVDTIPFSQAEPSLRADLIIKIVLGAINSAIDHGKARHLCFINLLEEWLLSKVIIVEE